MADGIQIGRGYIAIDLDEAGAKAALDVLKEKIQGTLREASKKTEVDISTAKATAELDKLKAKIVATRQSADDNNKAFRDMLDTMSGVAKIVGLWAPALAVGTLATQAASGGVIQLVAAAGSLLGLLGLLPAGVLVAGGAVAALTVGLSGVATAIQALNSGDAKAAAAALKGLAPDARDAVLALHGIDFTPLKLADQNALFSGLASIIKDLGHSELPLLQSGLVGVAGALNGGFKDLLTNVGSDNSLRDQSLLFIDIKDTLQELAPAGASFVDILRNVSTVGAGFLPQLAERLSTVLSNLDQIIARARSDGSLQQWIQGGITSAGQLVRTVENLGSILGSVFKAGQAAGANFFGELQSITGEIAQFLKSAQGQQDITKILNAGTQAASQLVPLLKDAVTALAGFAPVLSPIAATLAPAIDSVIKALGPGLQNLDPGLQAVARGIASILNGVVPLLDPVSRLANEAGLILGPALSGLAHILDSLVPILSGAASAISFITSNTGDLVPIVLVAVAALKTFSNVQGVFTNGSAAKGISSAADAISKFALNAGVAVESLTGSAKAGTAVATAGDKIASTVKGIGGALPVIGVALLGVGAIIQAVSDHSKELAAQAEATGKGLVIGGSAGVAAAAQMATYQKSIDNASSALAVFSAAQEKQQAQAAKKLSVPQNLGNTENAEGFGALDPQTDGGDTQALLAAQQKLNAANAAAAAYRATLTSTQLAQVKATQAQLDYDNAVRNFGPHSAEAQSAMVALQGATQSETDAEWAAQKATESHQDALQDLLNQALASANASANLKLAVLDLGDAQKTATDATKKSGAQSEDAQRAEAQYELQLNQVVQATHDKAMADSASLPPSAQVAAANKAVTEQILNLAIAAGKNAPPALQALAAKTYDANSAALTAASNTKGLKTAVLDLPGGKTIKIAVDSNGNVVLGSLANQVAALTGPVHYIRIGFKVGAAPQLTQIPKAGGGPVQPNVPYLVGEHGPETIIPDRQSYVLPSAQTRSVLGGTTQQTKATTLNQYNSFPIGLSEQQVADMAASAATWKLRTSR